MSSWHHFEISYINNHTIFCTSLTKIWLFFLQYGVPCGGDNLVINVPNSAVQVESQRRILSIKTRVGQTSHHLCATSFYYRRLMTSDRWTSLQGAIISHGKLSTIFAPIRTIGVPLFLQQRVCANPKFSLGFCIFHTFTHQPAGLGNKYWLHLKKIRSLKKPKR